MGVLRDRSRLCVPWRRGTVLLTGSLVFLVTTCATGGRPFSARATGTLDATVYMTVGEYTWPDQDGVIALRHERRPSMAAAQQRDAVIAEASQELHRGGESVCDYYRAAGCGRQRDRFPDVRWTAPVRQPWRTDRGTHGAAARLARPPMGGDCSQVASATSTWPPGRVLFGGRAQIRRWDAGDLAAIYRNPM